jgi:hypothetical protein
MKETKNSWQDSVSTPSVSKTISFESSKKLKSKERTTSTNLLIPPADQFKEKRYSFDDNGGGYMGL